MSSARLHLCRSAALGLSKMLALKLQAVLRPLRDGRGSLAVISTLRSASGLCSCSLTAEHLSPASGAPVDLLQSTPRSLACCEEYRSSDYLLCGCGRRLKQRLIFSIRNEDIPYLQRNEEAFAAAVVLGSAYLSWEADDGDSARN